MYRSWFAGFALCFFFGNGGCGIPSTGTATPSPGDTQNTSDSIDKKTRTLRISYQSPFGNTDILELNGMFRPAAQPMLLQRLSPERSWWCWSRPLQSS